MENLNLHPFIAQTRFLEQEEDNQCTFADQPKMYRDCCNGNPLLLCRVFAGISMFILVASLSTSAVLFRKRILSMNEQFNRIIHLTVNLTILSTYSQYLSLTIYYRQDRLLLGQYDSGVQFHSLYDMVLPAYSLLLDRCLCLHPQLVII